MILLSIKQDVHKHNIYQPPVVNKIKLILLSIIQDLQKNNIYQPHVVNKITLILLSTKQDMQRNNIYQPPFNRLIKCAVKLEKDEEENQKAANKGERAGQKVGILSKQSIRIKNVGPFLGWICQKTWGEKKFWNKMITLQG